MGKTYYNNINRTSINNKENCYDVFVVSESWLNSTVSNAEVEIEGYKFDWIEQRNQEEAYAYTLESR